MLVTTSLGHVRRGTGTPSEAIVVTKTLETGLL